MTSSARVRDGRLVIRVPAWMDDAQLADVVDRTLVRVAERAAAPLPRVPLPDRVPTRATRGPRGPRGDVVLVARADAVADRWLGGVRAERVVWSHRMHTRWASCTPDTGHVRISSRLADAPDEVLDNTLLHELAHLLERGHGPAFHALMARDPATPVVDAWLRRRSRLVLRAALGTPADGRA